MFRCAEQGAEDNSGDDMDSDDAPRSKRMRTRGSHKRQRKRVTININGQAVPQTPLTPSRATHPTGHEHGHGHVHGHEHGHGHDMHKHNMITQNKQRYAHVEACALTCAMDRQLRDAHRYLRSQPVPTCMCT